MTVCVTGDVHHMSLGTRDQDYLDRTELEAAIEYAEIASRHDIPVTLFITGKAVEEEPDVVRTLAEMRHVEIGGHNYYAFDTPIHTAWRGLEKLTRGVVGSWNGPRPYQAWEIQQTQESFHDLGIEITSWRDHAYRHDEHTAPLLSKRGFTHFSDAVGPDEQVGVESGLTTVPINTPPDHEHVYHAFRTPEFVEQSDFTGPFGTESWGPVGWVDRVVERTSNLVSQGQCATILAHPACLDIADGLDSFRRLCENLEEISDMTCLVSEVEVD